MLRFLANNSALRSLGARAAPVQLSVRHATKKAGGSSTNGRDSPGQRLGVKKFGGEKVIPGNIIIRQRGKKYHCGSQVGMGRDHTIFSTAEGWVSFKYDRRNKHQVVSVVAENPNPPPYRNQADSAQTAEGV